MIVKNWKKDILTIPNLLSLFRLILIPVYMVIYLNAQTVSWRYRVLQIWWTARSPDILI